MPEPTAEQIAAQAAAEAKEKGAEGGEKNDPQQMAQPDPIEEAARAKGWKPQEEFTGEPGTWIDAKEFLGREPLFAALKESKREAKELRRTVEGMAKHMRKTVEFQVNQRIAELNAAKKTAIEEGDVAKVEKIDNAIEKAKEAKADAPTAAEVAPEVTAWVEANPWYTADAELHDFALALNDTYLKRHPGDIEGCLRHITTQVKKAFPEKFAAEKKAEGGNGADKAGVKPKVAAVESGQSPGAKSKSYTMSRLNADQKNVCEQYVRAGVMTVEEYVKSLEDIGELTK